MPYARCPVCASRFHLAISEPRGPWEREHVEQRDADGLPLLRCIRCWVDLRPGHRVSVRSVPEELSSWLKPGREGVVEAVSPLDPGVCTVVFGTQRATLRREELFYLGS